MNKLFGRKSKGIDFSIRTVAMIVLGILVITLMYVAFDTTTSTIIESFLGELTVPSVD